MGKSRQAFLSEMAENVLLPYEVREGRGWAAAPEGEGAFESAAEEACFERFVARVGAGGAVLDLACGDGRHTLPLAERCGQVVGVDLSARNLALAREWCAGKENVAFARGSMLELDFRAGSFDGIWFSQAFEYVPPERRAAVLASLGATLRPGGILYMSVETWLAPGMWASLRGLWQDVRLFLYWRVVKGEPLRWGEFLYRLRPEVAGGQADCWHYHVHTGRRTLRRLLGRQRFGIEFWHVEEGLIYLLCQKPR
jgi:SAM-dependent methyltransferase